MEDKMTDKARKMKEVKMIKCKFQSKRKCCIHKEHSRTKGKRYKFICTDNIKLNCPYYKRLE